MTQPDHPSDPADRMGRKAHDDLGWDALLGHLADRAHTLRGAAAARSLAPSLDPAWIRLRSAEIGEARALWDRGAPMPFGAIFDIAEHLVRAEKSGQLDGPALREVAATLDAAGRLRRHLAASGGPGAGFTPHLAGRAALIAELADVSGPILEAFDDAGLLLDSASAALGPLRRKASAVRDELDRRSHTLLDNPAWTPHLQDCFYTRRDERFVLPIRVDARTRVKGIVHGVSGSGQTVFVEPEEIVDLNNRLKLAELEVAEEERRILAELTALVAAVVRPIRINLEVLAELDLIDAGARLAIDLKAREAALAGDDGGTAIDLRRARHPLMVLGGRECVPNDIVLELGGTLIVSGPNAGGKTVALKTAGLLSLMLRAGLHLPAQEGSSLPLFRVVLTDVGDDQSLERNLSTFSAHVMNLNAFLAAAGPDTLLLLDEIAVGTDPEQGSALAEAVLTALADRGATVIVTTHYERLKAMAPRDPRFHNASVGFDLATLAPTYQLHLGVPGASGAIVVARRLGLPEPIAARAESLLAPGTLQTEALLNQIGAERQRLADALEIAQAERAAAAADRQAAEEMQALAEERLKTARKGEHDQALESLKRARTELDRLRAELRRSASPSRAALEDVERAIDASGRDVARHAPRPDRPSGRPPTAAELVPGSDVLVARLGARGVVVGPARAGRIVVQVGPLKLTVDAADLLVPSPSHGSPARAAVATHRADQPKAPLPAAPQRADAGKEPLPDEIRTTGNTLDLRGERVEAALALAEKFLDDALRAGQDVVFFVHGHGTGALRSALREHLAALPGVGAVRPGQGVEGGEGVTVATLA